MFLFLYCRTHLAQDKGDISILPESDKNGVIDLGIPDVGELKEVELTVINQSNRRHSFGCVVLGTTTDFNVDYVGYDFMGKEISSQVELAGNSRSPITIPVTINEHNPGVFHVVVAFWFRCGTGDPFHIVKFVKVDFRNDVVNELQPTVPYEKPEPLCFDPNVDCIKGEKLPM